MGRSLWLVSLLAASFAAVTARADGPVDAAPGMARLVDGPALKAAFSHAPAGTVELAFRLDGSGEVHGVRILASEPAGIFDAAALSMVEGTRLPLPPGAAADQEHHVVIHFQNDREPRAQLDPAP